MDSGTCISLFLPRSHRQNLNHIQKYEEGFIKSDIPEQSLEFFISGVGECVRMVMESDGELRYLDG